jgi:hypothetical protein
VTVPLTGMPTFTDGQFVRQAPLNTLSTGINNLSYLLAGAAATRSYIPAAAVKITSSQSIANSVDQTVTWNTAGVNNDVMWSSAAPDHLTVVTGGVYVCMAQVHFAANGTGHRAAHIMTNGTSIIANSIAVTAMAAVGTSADTLFLCISPPTRLAVGAQIFLSVYQNSGAALNVLTTLACTALGAIRVGQ